MVTIELVDRMVRGVAGWVVMMMSSFAAGGEESQKATGRQHGNAVVAATSVTWLDGHIIEVTQ